MKHIETLVSDLEMDNVDPAKVHLVRELVETHIANNKKHVRLLDKVRRLRGIQKSYFKYRSSADLELSKRLERELDKMIDEEVKEQKSLAQKLF